MNRIIIAVCFYLASLAGSIQATTPGEIDWLGTIGHDKGNDKLLFSLLFLGFFRQDLSPGCENFRETWLQKHPFAKLVPVALIKPLVQRDPESQLLFVWIIDQHDNLTVDLVRHGCVPATAVSTLISGARLEVSQKEFESVKAQLLTAEKLAKTEKLGIWSADDTDEDEE